MPGANQGGGLVNAGKGRGERCPSLDTPKGTYASGGGVVSFRQLRPSLEGAGLLERGPCAWCTRSP